MASYADDQETAFKRLKGVQIRGWWGIEMAMRGGETEDAQFSDPSVPYLQFLSLHATLDSDDQLDFLTYQNDDNFGLRLSASAANASRDESWSGIYRARSMPEIPCGNILSIRVVRDNCGDIERVALSVAGCPVTLIAGEVYEETDGSLRVQLGGDESVLVSLSADA
jgi:hypothetical protein